MKSNKPHIGKNVDAVGIAWYSSRESYDRCLAIFDDSADLPTTFDAWLVKAKEVENDLRHQGMRVVRVVIDPDTFVSWCAANGHDHVDRDARMHFGNLKAHEYIKGQV